jgi:hypothetical protein
MTATNHALTGALIGVTVSNPVLAVALAFTSHFVLDGLPHFGGDDKRLKLPFNGRLFQTILFADIVLCLLLAGVFALTQPAHWFVIVLCAFVATSPDFAWFPDYLAALKRKPLPVRGPLRKFAAKIQWSQTLPGAIPEFVWALTMLSLLLLKLT